MLRSFVEETCPVTVGVSVLGIDAVLLPRLCRKLKNITFVSTDLGKMIHFCSVLISETLAVKCLNLSKCV